MQDQNSLNQKDILVVDDVAEICTLLSDFFKMKGHRADAANTFQQARELLSENRYSLVITNLYLGQKSSADGLQVIQLVKKLAPEAAVIVMSGGASNETWSRLARFKVQGLFRKPFTLENLYVAVRNAMNGSLVNMTAT